MNRSPDYDELVLANPIYMYLHGPKMSYPAHTHPDYMVVHPPTHYVVIATFMRMGLDLFHAAGAPIFLLVLLCLSLIVTGRFAFEVKMGLIFGFYLGIFVWGAFRPLRPDLHLAAAWFTGLVALESARFDGWSSWRLALGAFLLTYASGIHYPGSFALLGCVIYMVWCLWNLGWKQGGRRTLIMAAAGAAFGIPYLAWFVLPYRREIQEVVTSVATATFSSPWRLHFATYNAWWSQPDLTGAFYRWMNRPVTAALTAPLFLTRVPAAIVAPVALFLHPSTRGIALAALPHLLFLLFFVGGQGKNQTNTGYYAPEFILYLSVLVIGLLMLGRKMKAIWVGKRWPVWTAYAPAILLSAAALIDVPNSMASHRALTRSLDYEDVVRAAGYQILGPGAVVGTAAPVLWYHSGAEALYFITPDLLYPDDISKLDLNAYFDHFDAFGISPETSGFSWNRDHKSLISWYADGTLKLQGFVIDSQRLLSYLLVGTRTKGPLQGYQYDVPSKRLWHFTETPDGDTVFLSYIAPMERIAGQPEFQPEFWGSERFPLPGVQKATVGEDVLNVELAPLRDIALIKERLSQFKILQEVRGRIEKIDSAQLVAKLDGAHPLSIPRTLAELDSHRVQSVLQSTRPDFESVVPSATVQANLLDVDGYLAQEIDAGPNRSRWSPVQSIESRTICKSRAAASP